MQLAALTAIAILAACAPSTLPPPAAELKPIATDADAEKAAGFIALFNGTDLEGWAGDTKGYKVEALEGGAAIVCQKGGTNLFTAEEYGDFEFRFEFLLTPGANNGIALRAPLQGDPAYAGFESQVLDNTADQYKGLKEWQYHGSIYGIAPATATALRPVGEWNHETITMKGRTVKVELNGVVIIDIDLDKVAPDGKTVSGNKVEGLKREKGHIGFCGHGDRVAYRNLRVKKL
ncbi:MAG: hypothetical protein RL136_2430 [Planctomycetota bacterium]|jgi:hypothetical protein